MFWIAITFTSSPSTHKCGYWWCVGQLYDFVDHAKLIPQNWFLNTILVLAIKFQFNHTWMKLHTSCVGRNEWQSFYWKAKKESDLAEQDSGNAIITIGRACVQTYVLVLCKIRFEFKLRVKYAIDAAKHLA